MFEWFRGISGQADKNYEAMLSDLCGLPVDGDYPFFFPNHEHGASWEFSRASFLNLKAGHGRVHLGRAVVESIGFSILETVETLREAGLSIDEIRVCGGQSKNAYWNQMKADMCGKPILVPRVKDAELMGDAIMGLVGLGIRDSVVATAEELFVVEKEIIPKTERTRAFRPRYEAYRELADRIAVAHELIFAPDPAPAQPLQ